MSPLTVQVTDAETLTWSYTLQLKGHLKNYYEKK